MENLVQTAQFLEASSRLRLASYWLGQLADNTEKKPDLKGQADLAWAGRFLTEVDWTSSPERPSGPSGEFAIQATSVRPLFYSSLVRFRQDLREAGINDPKTLAKFFNALYAFLSLKDYQIKQKPISCPEMKLGAAFLEEISQSLLVQLNGNGLPPVHSRTWDGTLMTGCDLRPAMALGH
ncbi:MAG: hypothetical protein KGL39_53590 [Patescibacteria group bacterium]|nr:hypothetical protein [Patescibacteria group bacterium]